MKCVAPKARAFDEVNPQCGVGRQSSTYTLSQDPNQDHPSETSSGYSLNQFATDFASQRSFIVKKDERSEVRSTKGESL